MLRVSDALVPKVCALCGTVDVARFDPTVLPVLLSSPRKKYHFQLVLTHEISSFKSSHHFYHIPKPDYLLDYFAG